MCLSRTNNERKILGKNVETVSLRKGGSTNHIHVPMLGVLV